MCATFILLAVPDSRKTAPVPTGALVLAPTAVAAAEGSVAAIAIGVAVAVGAGVMSRLSEATATVATRLIEYKKIQSHG